MKQEKQREHSASRAKWVFAGFALIAGYFLIAEHRAHLSGVLQYLPFLLLLACPLMHVFMHGHHGGHCHESSQREQGDRDKDQS